MILCDCPVYQVFVWYKTIRLNVKKHFGEIVLKEFFKCSKIFQGLTAINSEKASWHRFFMRFPNAMKAPASSRLRICTASVKDILGQNQYQIRRNMNMLPRYCIKHQDVSHPYQRSRKMECIGHVQLNSRQASGSSTATPPTCRECYF